jgi:ethanolamine ammonia-lyase small subunit
MTLPSRPLRTLDDLKALTPARVALGRVGAGLPTRALLDFTLDHARARDAVHAPFDAETLGSDLAGLGLEPVIAASQVADRGDYLKRPDLGRLLDASSEARLAERRQPPCDMVLVIADGLSPAAVNAHASELVRGLLPRLVEAGIGLGPAVVASGARVALGDRIGALLNARMVVLLIGERPGLTAPHSLGAYLTFAPRPGLTDADRNCVSNIHAAGLSYDEATFKIAWLVRAGLARSVTGVALKDDSGVRPTTAIMQP